MENDDVLEGLLEEGEIKQEEQEQDHQQREKGLKTKKFSWGKLVHFDLFDLETGRIPGNHSHGSHKRAFAAFAASVVGVYNFKKNAWISLGVVLSLTEPRAVGGLGRAVAFVFLAIGSSTGTGVLQFGVREKLRPVAIGLGTMQFESKGAAEVKTGAGEIGEASEMLCGQLLTGTQRMFDDINCIYAQYMWLCIVNTVPIGWPAKMLSIARECAAYHLSALVLEYIVT
ncbi:hypothetical protein HHK36_026461 [Tetracentron sinense]|uniref:Uncharacterized protein n=1 Tax=Tetracentron sinense TaxID=13715 RepID=A0A834YG39_TETSI|nr:hypothetical protein HHK36_026461 [Tetracentron sinense]